jgi:hypothetical protein
MKKIRILSIFLALGIILAMVVPVGAGAPGTPYGVTGTVTLNGSAVAEGTEVSAWVYGYECANSTVLANDTYKLLVRTISDNAGDEHCGNNGDQVIFHIGNIVADLTGTFNGGNSPLASINLYHSGNSKPMAYGQAIVISQLAPTTITLTGFDAEGDTLTYVNGAPLPAKGTITGVTNQKTYTPCDDLTCFKDYGYDTYYFMTRQGTTGNYVYSFPSKVYITVDDPPTDIILSDPYVGSGQPVDTVVGTLGSSHVNVSTLGTTQKTFTYSLVSGTGDTNNASFNIYFDSGSGISSLRTSAALVAGQTYSVRIRSTDNFGLSLDKIFAIHAVDPTAVNLMNFTAKVQKNIATPEDMLVHAGSNSVLLSWETASEANNLGFNLYRATSADGLKTKLNAALIPAQLSVSGAASASYSYTDSGLKDRTTYYYWLESVDNHGVTSLTGPVSAKLVGGKTR